MVLPSLHSQTQMPDQALLASCQLSYRSQSLISLGFLLSSASLPGLSLSKFALYDAQQLTWTAFDYMVSLGLCHRNRDYLKSISILGDPQLIYQRWCAREQCRCEFRRDGLAYAEVWVMISPRLGRAQIKRRVSCIMYADIKAIELMRDCIWICEFGNCGKNDCRYRNDNGTGM